MAGTLTIDTLKASSGVLATQNGMTGIAKGWLQYNGQTQTVNGSYNVSSVTRSSAGFFTVNLTTAMSNANYAAIGSCFFYTTSNASGNDILQTTGQTTTSFVFITKSSGSTAEDVAQVSVAIFGA